MVSIRPWDQTPQGQALLAACVTNPPRKIACRQDFYLTSDEWTEYDREDARVQALDAFANEHFIAAERLGGRAAALTAVSIPVDHAIDLALFYNSHSRAA